MWEAEYKFISATFWLTWVGSGLSPAQTLAHAGNTCWDKHYSLSKYSKTAILLVLGQGYY
jgi:hypothetical protein